MIGKRLRFEIFKRDGFQCRYCGRTAVASPLHVESVYRVEDDEGQSFHADHVDPKSKGGPDHPANLVTACKDCNLGKGDVRLDDVRYKTREQLTEDQREHAEQIREYLRVHRDIVDARKEVVELALAHWEDVLGDWHWSVPNLLRTPIDELGLPAVLRAMDITGRRNLRYPLDHVRYFCGVLRNMRAATGPVPAPTSAEELSPSFDVQVNAARWETALAVLASYYSYRFRDSPYEGFNQTVRAAIGTSPGGSPAIQMEDVFQIIDNAAWQADDDASVSFDGYQDRTSESVVVEQALRLAIAGEQVLDSYWTGSTFEGSQRARQLDKAQEVNRSVVAAYGGIGSCDAAVQRGLIEAVADALDLCVDLIPVAIDVLSRVPRFPDSPAALLSSFRSDFAREHVNVPWVHPDARIRRWPEYEALIVDDESNPVDVEVEANGGTDSDDQA